MKSSCVRPGLLAAVLFLAHSALAAYDTVCYFDSTSYSGVEGTTLSIKVTRTKEFTSSTFGDYNDSKPFTTSFEINPSLSDPITAADVPGVSGWHVPVTIPAFNDYTTVLITLGNNPTVEQNRTATLTMNGTKSTGGLIQTATMTVFDNDQVVSIGLSDNTSGKYIIEGGVSGGDRAVIRISRNATIGSKTVVYTNIGTAAQSNFSPVLSGTATMAAGVDHVDITNIALLDSIKKTNQTIIVKLLSGDGTYTIDPGAVAITNTILDDLPEVWPEISTARMTEGMGQVGIVIKRSYCWPQSSSRAINLLVGGTARNGVDFTPALPNVITIPAGQTSVTNLIAPARDGIVDGVNTLILTVQPGGFYNVSAGNSVTNLIYDDYPVFQISSDNFKIFTITRSGDLAQSVTAQLNVTGTALPGVDYIALPSTVTLPPGVLSTNLVIKRVTNSILSSAKTIVVGLKTDVSYFLGISTNAVVTIADDPANPRSNNPGKNYVRGGGTNLAYYSIVAPLDDLKGTRRPDWDPASTYAAHYHYDAGSTADQHYASNRIVFNMPIASFGSAWGMPLYLGQSYSLGFYQGLLTTNPVNIRVYSKTTGSYVGTTSITLPLVTSPSDWASFETNGFARTVSGYGLTTVLRWTPSMTWGSGSCAWQLTHTATSPATNYTFLICATGKNDQGSMVIDGSEAESENYFYELNFDDRPAWRSVFVDQPQFQGEPLPPELWNKTPTELLNYGMSVSNAVALAPSACLAIDQSPELRRHPILDQFVSDMNNDPLALANYVQNEIDLSDTIAYRDDGTISSQSINEGGMNRGALGVYLEGQGSPIEQCALLIYLLRQAGYPATYVFPPSGGLKMLDTRLSSLLRMRINGAQDQYGHLYTTNQLIPVNYPWVAVNISNQWVHIFPWIKDTAVEEGLDLYDYMPTPYQDAQLWVKDYIYGKTNIMAFATPDDDTLGTIFPRYLTSALQANAPGISVNDIGMRYTNRRHIHSRWTDFPRPTWVTNACTAVESLSSSGIVNVSPTLTNIFDTLQLELYSINNPQKDIQTPPLRMADLHNRTFYLTHTSLGNGQIQASLILCPFRPNATNMVGNFDTNADPALLNKQVLSLVLDTTDDSLGLRFRQRRQRALSWQTALDPYTAFLDVRSTREVLVERPLRKGDVAGICLDVGRVTPAMLRVHAQEIWNMEQLLSTNSGAAGQISSDVYQGSLVYLMGMNYYQRVSKNDELLRELCKIQKISSVAMGLAKISPRRDAYGYLYGGGVDPIWPNVDMFFQEVTAVGNGAVRLDSGRDYIEDTRNYRILKYTDRSSQEHAILNSFFGLSNSMSTVKLLQLAQSKVSTGGPSIVELTYNNYQLAGNVPYNGKALKDYDSGLWAAIVSAFQGPDAGFTVAWVPPGSQTNASGSFVGMGALIFGQNSYWALIGNNQYGGYADQVPSVSTGNLSALTLTVDGDASYSVNLKAPTSGGQAAAPEVSAAFEVPTDIGYLNNNTYAANPNQVQQGQVDGIVLNGSQGTYLGMADDVADVGLVGTRTDDKKSNGIFAFVEDPVNALSGEFYIDTVDISLPGPMPLQIRRNYGSQNLVNNMLGYGWKLNYMPYLTVARSNNIIYAAEADGSVLAFGSIDTNLWAPTTALNPMLNNNSANGIGSVANRLNERLAREVVGNVTYWYLTNADGGRRVFQEMSFPLTSSASFDRSRPYLTTWFDNRGNYHSFEYGTNSTQADYGQVRRIVSSSGNVLRFEYDVYGRVVDAYSLDGRRVDYAYDDHGDLVTVTLPDTSEINYEYQLLTWTTNSTTTVYSTHLLVRENKPDGRVIQNDYDNQRRVTNQWSTAGPDLRLIRTASFAYTNNFNLTNITDSLTGTTTILDYTNNPTVYYYTNGLIRRIHDPIGADLVQEWYESSETNAPAYPRSLKRVTDKRGLITSYSYDSQGNATTVTVQGDLCGDGNTNATATTSAVYSNALPTMVIDAKGATNLFFYTNAWLLARQEIWPSNSASAQAITNLFNYTNVSASGKASYGLRWQEIQAANSPDAATNEWSYNAQGYPIKVTRYTGNNDPAVTVTNLYNTRGELAVQTDVAGRSTIFGYDPRGNLQSHEVYDVGQSIPMSWDYSYYNETGELVWSDGPRYSPEDYIWRDYDGSGRKTQEIHWRIQGKADGTGVEAPSGYNLYATSFYQYDPLGDLTKAVDPLGNYSLKKYDSVGRLLREEFYGTNGTLISTNGFAYNLAGDVTNAYNALGGLTEKQYTFTGKLKYQRNPDGSTNAWRYYADGRLWREIQRNGSYWETTYADAPRTITKVFYNVGGTRLATNVTVFDRRGNAIQQIDAAQNVFNTKYDGLNRIKSSSGPAITSVTFTNGGFPSPGDGGYQTNILQQTTGYIYDASGVVLTVTNALGEKTVTTSDPLGRVRSVQIYTAGASTPLRVTTTTYSPDQQSATVTEGTGATAISTTTYTDNDGRVVISTRSPVSGQSDYILNVYDLAGNNIESDQLSSIGGEISLWSASQWTYDGLNRVSVETTRDNAVTRFFYDAMGNLTNRSMPSSLTWSATYSAAGQIRTEQNSNGSQITRSKSYNYYPAGNPWAGLLNTTTDGAGVTKATSYDDWLRVASVTAAGTRNEQQMNASWQYDRRGLLTNISQSFTIPGTGPSSTVERSFDPYRQLTGETVTLGGTIFSTVRQGWNGAGRRSQLSTSRDWTMGYQYRADGLVTAVNGAVFGYGDNGLLTGRTNAFRSINVNQRDGEGRPLQATTITCGQVLSESWAWLGDGSPWSYTSPCSEFADTRSFVYGSLHRRLAQEKINLSANRSITNFYTFDNGMTGRLGVLTKVGPNASSGQWSGGMDAFSRVTGENNSVVHRTARGRVNSEAGLRGYLNGQPMYMCYDSSAGGTWTVDMALSPGNYTFNVYADAPSGTVTANDSRSFTVASGAADQESDQYDAVGNVTNRVWKDSTGLVLKSQILTWDAFNRLVNVTERDAQNNGFNYQIDFDGLGRQLRTTHTTVSNNIALSAKPQPLVTGFIYDPAVEFQFIGVNITQGTASRQDWLTYGPDISGTYGGMQGVGGLETITTSASSGSATAGVISDAFGNVLAGVTNRVLATSASRLSLYGPVEGFAPPRISLDVPLYQSLAFRTRPLTPFGTLQLGVRPYDYVRRSFLSFDPIWNGGDPNGFTAFGGRPSVYFDADGRLAKGFYSGYNSDTVHSDDSTARMLGYYAGGVLCGFNQGLDEGSYIVADTATLGQIDSLHSYASSLQGDVYDASRALATIGVGSLALATGGAALESPSLYLGAMSLANNPVAQTAGLSALTGFAMTLEEGGSVGDAVGNGTLSAGFGMLAVGIPTQRTASGDFYSVAFETRLRPTSYPGVSRAAHFQEANEALLSVIEGDAQFAQMMQQTGVSLSRTATGLAPWTSPAGWTWHHAEAPGSMQLVPRLQHTPGSIYWDTLHLGGLGGYAIWGK